MFGNLIECSQPRSKRKLLPIFCATMLLWLMVMGGCIGNSIYEIFAAEPKLEGQLCLYYLDFIPLTVPPFPNLSQHKPQIIWRSYCAPQNDNAIARIKPDYPACARKAGIAGDVIVKIYIDEKGDVVKARVISGPPALREAALAASKQWKFTPDLVYGQALKLAGLITFRFRL